MAPLNCDRFNSNHSVAPGCRWRSRPQHHKRTTVARTTEFKARHPPKSSDASQSANDNGLLGVGLVVRHVIVRSYLLNDPRSKFRAANAVGSIASESARTVHKFLPTTRCFLYRAWPESFCTNRGWMDTPRGGGAHETVFSLVACTVFVDFALYGASPQLPHRQFWKHPLRQWPDIPHRQLRHHAR